MTREEAIDKVYGMSGTKEQHEALEFLIPEVRELREFYERQSEDERIRKELIEFIQWSVDRHFMREDFHQAKRPSEWITYLEKQQEASKAIEAVERIDKYIDEHVANAYDMKDSNPDKKYYRGLDDALGKIAGILQDVYSGEKQKESLRDFIDDFPYSDEQKDNKFAPRVLPCSAAWFEDGDDKQKEQKPDTKDADDLQLLGFIYDLLNEIEWKDSWAMSKDECLRRLNNYRPQKPAEWSEDYQEEDIQTRFAFYTYKDEDGVLYLSNVFVEETSRNHGFGTKILIAAEKVAETIGATTISLKVKQDSPANAWYRKNGYGYVAFEDGYDWLEKNLEYLKPKKGIGWSEEDEKKLQECIKIVERWEEDYDIAYAPYSNTLKSLRPQPKDEIYKEKYEAFKLGKHQLAIKFMNYLDENRPEGKMSLSNAECEDIDKAFKGNDWERIMRYTNKYAWKPSEEQMKALLNAEGFLRAGLQHDSAKTIADLYEQLKKL